MRNAFIRSLTAIAERDPRVMLLTADLGFTVFENFRDHLPRQFLNVGIAEQNMISVAAGLALTGRRVVVFSIVPFATFRCLEQIRNDLCHQRLPVSIVGVGAGYSYGHLGSSHHALEDIAVMRSLPGMTVISPGDPWEVEQSVQSMLTLPGPCYLRLGKSGEASVHSVAAPPIFKLGTMIVVRPGNAVTIFATGSVLTVALEAARILSESAIDARVLSVHTLKPIDREAIIAAATETSLLATVEEHGPIGGLRSSVADVIAETGLGTRLLSFSAPEFVSVKTGSQQCLREESGLTPANIASQIMKYHALSTSSITGK